MQLAVRNSVYSAPQATVVSSNTGNTSVTGRMAVRWAKQRGVAGMVGALWGCPSVCHRTAAAKRFGSISKGPPAAGTGRGAGLDDVGREYARLDSNQRPWD